MSTAKEQKLQVLLVEDDEDDYLLTRDFLNEIDAERYEINWIKSFDEAVGLEDGACFDICLLDYRLGAHTGVDLMKKLNEKGFSCPMILLTGQSDSEIDHLAMEAGAADYLTKGNLNAVDLERAIRYSIQQKKLHSDRIKLMMAQEAAERAEAANKAKDDFLAVLSHELRSPLNVMLGWSRLLKTQRLDEETFNKAIDAIERSTLIQSKFVEDLLDINRIVTGSIAVKRRPISLNAIIESSVNGIRPSAAERSIGVEVELPASELSVNGDPERLMQVMNNILTNAVKFTPQEGTIEASLASTVDGNARITIKDSGQGIPADVLPHIFDRYRQGHESSVAGKGGLGLGLAIVRHLVELHDGEVSAESEGEGKGSIFTILLPLEENNSFEQAA